MMGKKILITTVALAAAGVGVAGILMNTKQARTRRMLKKTGKAMYTIGTMLRTLSCQTEG